MVTCPTDSPRTAFFWSEKVRPAHMTHDKVFLSFKGAVRAEYLVGVINLEGNGAQAEGLRAGFLCGSWLVQYSVLLQS